MSEARMTIPKSEYLGRVKKVQLEMEKAGIDLLVTHACECESANVRYLSNFWAVFDFVSVLVPREGDAILLTGGPESYDFAVQFSQIDDIRIHPLYVETAAPEWDKPTDTFDFSMILDEIRAKQPVKTIGIANANIIPHAIMQDVQNGAQGAKFVEAQAVMNAARLIKSNNEINLLREGYRITEQAFIDTLGMVGPGVREWELEAKWRGSAYAMGAEGTSYPIWVTSGDTTYQSLCKSTDKPIVNDSMVQFSVGAKYNGYCGNLCRAVVLGKIPQKHEDMIRVSLDSLGETIEMMRPGVAFASVYDRFQQRLAENGFTGLNLYGPAHGTGLQECEGPWVDNRTDSVLEPGMVFNVDVWIADEQYGVRIEDGLVITETGIEVFTNYRREIIRL